jgi:hypothetical protein
MLVMLFSQNVHLAGYPKCVAEPFLFVIFPIEELQNGKIEAAGGVFYFYFL